MAKRPSKKEDLAAIRAVLQRELKAGGPVDEVFSTAYAELPEAYERVTSLSKAAHRDDGNG